eukprot:IDg9408t1
MGSSYGNGGENLIPRNIRSIPNHHFPTVPDRIVSTNIPISYEKRAATSLHTAQYPIHVTNIQPLQAPPSNVSQAMVSSLPSFTSISNVTQLPIENEESVSYTHRSPSVVQEKTSH